MQGSTEYSWCGRLVPNDSEPIAATRGCSGAMEGSTHRAEPICRTSRWRQDKGRGRGCRPRARKCGSSTTGSSFVATWPTVDSAGADSRCCLLGREQPFRVLYRLDGPDMKPVPVMHDSEQALLQAGTAVQGAQGEWAVRSVFEQSS